MVTQLMLPSSRLIIIRVKMNCQISPTVIKLILLIATPKGSDSRLGDTIGFTI